MSITYFVQQPHICIQKRLFLSDHLIVFQTIIFIKKPMFFQENHCLLSVHTFCPKTYILFKNHCFLPDHSIVFQTITFLWLKTNVFARKLLFSVQSHIVSENLCFCSKQIVFVRSLNCFPNYKPFVRKPMLFVIKQLFFVRSHILSENLCSCENNCFLSDRLIVFQTISFLSENRCFSIRKPLFLVRINICFYRDQD